MGGGSGSRDPEKNFPVSPIQGQKSTGSGSSTLVKVSGKLVFPFIGSGHSDQIGNERAFRPVPARLAALLFFPAGGRGELRAHAQPLRQLGGQQ
jgi:hypothetical protein